MTRFVFTPREGETGWEGSQRHKREEAAWQRDPTPPKPPTLTPADVAAIRAIKSSLLATNEALTTHDRKSQLYRDLFQSGQARVAALLTNTDPADDESVRNYGHERNRQEVLVTWLGTAAARRAGIVSGVHGILDRLKQIVLTLAPSASVAPPPFAVTGHPLASRVSLALSEIENLLLRPEAR